MKLIPGRLAVRIEQVRTAGNILIPFRTQKNLHESNRLSIMDKAYVVSSTDVEYNAGDEVWVMPNEGLQLFHLDYPEFIEKDAEYRIYRTLYKYALHDVAPVKIA